MAGVGLGGRNGPVRSKQRKPEVDLEVDQVDDHVASEIDFRAREEAPPPRYARSPSPRNLGEELMAIHDVQRAVSNGWQMKSYIGSGFGTKEEQSLRLLRAGILQGAAGDGGIRLVPVAPGRSFHVGFPPAGFNFFE